MYLLESYRSPPPSPPPSKGCKTHSFVACCYTLAGFLLQECKQSFFVFQIYLIWQLKYFGNILMTYLEKQLWRFSKEKLSTVHRGKIKDTSSVCSKRYYSLRDHNVTPPKQLLWREREKSPYSALWHSLDLGNKTNYIYTHMQGHTHTLTTAHYCSSLVDCKLFLLESAEFCFA